MRFLSAIAVFLMCCCPALAQKSKSMGYWFAAPGAVGASGSWSATVHLGGGGEVALPKGFALGLEGGAIGTTRDYKDSVVGVGSLNGYYHVLPGRWEKMDPFATVGYSLFFRRGTASLVNYGGGFNYWFRPHLAVRAEFRDHRHPDSGVHYWGFRFGLSFTELLP